MKLSSAPTVNYQQVPNRLPKGLVEGKMELELPEWVENDTLPEQMTYYVKTLDRDALSKELYSVVETLFDDISDSHPDLLGERTFFLEACELIGKKSPDTIIYRYEAINNHLAEFPELIVDLHDKFVRIRRNESQERKSVRRVRKFIKKLNNLTNRKLSISEYAQFVSIPSHVHPTINLDISGLPTAYRKCFSQAKIEEKVEEVESESPEEWLGSISSDLLDTYRNTEETLKEALLILDNAEDEYFVEQVSADYYPHIFAALKSFDHEKADFEHKETVVTESIKQLRIVQLGLQKIIDNTVSRHARALRSQTEFLRNKVLGEGNLSLTLSEADTLIETSVEEANRFRDELYKKHVAPLLERNKQDYEARIRATEDAFNQALDQASESHENELRVRDAAMVEQENRHSSIVHGVRTTHKREMDEQRDKFKQQLDYATEKINEADIHHQKDVASYRKMISELRSRNVSLKAKLNEKVKSGSHGLLVTKDGDDDWVVPPERLQGDMEPARLSLVTKLRDAKNYKDALESGLIDIDYSRKDSVNSRSTKLIANEIKHKKMLQAAQDDIEVCQKELEQFEWEASRAKEAEGLKQRESKSQQEVVQLEEELHKVKWQIQSEERKLKALKRSRFTDTEAERLVSKRIQYQKTKAQGLSLKLQKIRTLEANESHEVTVKQQIEEIRAINLQRLANNQAKAELAKAELDERLMDALDLF